MDERPIGVLDSGVGGVFVLRQAVRLLPQEKFLFYGDLGHAPYGSHTREEICHIAMSAAGHLASQGIKALLVACNTATSAAVEQMRSTFDFPVIGVEPALKPAAEAHHAGKIAVMATPATLALPKFARLMETCGVAEDLIPIPCPNLSLMVESCGPGSPEIRAYLAARFAEAGETPESVVLGCTHYSYLAKDLQALLGPAVRLYDGAFGAARQLARVLAQHGLLAEGEGSVKYETSGKPEDLAMMERFFAMAGDAHETQVD